MTTIASDVSAPIYILGDVMIDTSHITAISRLAPEACHVPVYSVQSTAYALGGAANVWRHCRSLGMENVHLITVVGKDELANTVRSLMGEGGVGSLLLEDSERPTTQKVRFYTADRNVMVSRYDVERTAFLSDVLERRIEEYVMSACPQPSMLVFSDYAKGMLTPNLVRRIIEWARTRQPPIPIFVDPPAREEADKYGGCTLLKPNEHEALVIGGPSMATVSSEEVAETLKRRMNCQTVVMTCGEKGMVCVDESCHVIRSSSLSGSGSVVNVSGAGDAVMSALVYFAVNMPWTSWEQRCVWANELATQYVQQVSPWTLSLEVIQDVVMRSCGVTGAGVSAATAPIWRWQMETMAGVERWREQQRAEGKAVVFTNGCFDVVHVGHLRLLHFAKSRGDILVVGLNSDASIRRLKGETRPIVGEEDRAMFLSLLTGIVDVVVIFGEDTPATLMRVLRPDVLVKGGDYKIEDVVGREYAGQTVLFSLVEGKSTTAIVEKIRRSV